MERKRQEPQKEDNVPDPSLQEANAIGKALRKLRDDCDDHDRSLIQERLAWTPEQRLEANAAFLRFYLSVRPEGPLIDT